MSRTYVVERGIVTPVAARGDRADTTVVEKTYWYTRRDPQEVKANEARIAARRVRDLRGGRNAVSDDRR